MSFEMPETTALVFRFIFRDSISFMNSQIAAAQCAWCKLVHRINIKLFDSASKMATNMVIM